MRGFVITIFLLISGVGFSQNPKRALTLLEKKDFSKAEQIFEKSIEKDSINPGAYYVHSLLFLKDSFPGYDPDSSYLLILKAIDHYTLIDQKEIDKLQKINITDSTLRLQKNKIDSLKFQQAVAINEESTYNLFLEKHPTAAQVHQVKTFRNRVAYEKARKINTYQSYKDFMDKYPQAKEVREANDKYNLLLFAEKTKERSLESYRHFLVEYPRTPYRETIEKNIFEIATAGNSKASFEKFIKDYPESKYAKKALDYLYYHRLENGQTAEGFAKEYSNAPYIDSIKSLIPAYKSILFPIYENQRYKFIDNTGKLAKGLEVERAIKESYYCRGVEKNFIIAGDRNNRSIIAKSGEIIYQGRFEGVEDLGYGLLKISDDGNYGIIHRSGWEVFRLEWDDITLIRDQFLVLKKNRSFGLATLTGRVIMSPEFQDIRADGHYFIFEKDGKFAITNERILVSFLESEDQRIALVYDDYQIVNQHVVAMEEGRERLINDRLETVILPATQKIYDQPVGWYVVKADSFLVYDHRPRPVFASPYDQYQLKDEWFALKQNDRWAYFNAEENIATNFEFDSVQFLNKNAIYLIEKGEKSISLANGDYIKIKEDQTFRLIRSNSGKNISDSLEYIVISEPRKRLTTVYNLKGDKIKSLTNTRINTLYKDNFIIEKNGKKGIMNSEGKIVLPAYYDAIGKPDKGVYSLLQRKKFGLFSASNKFTIRPEYESALSVYNQNLLLATKSGKSGFINHDNKEISPFTFEKIEYWNDSLAVVYKDDHWSIYDIYNDEYVGDNITSFQIFADAPEKKALILGEKGYGVLGSKSGTIIGPTFDDLRVIGPEGAHLYFCEKHVKEAGLYVVVYYDQKGKMIRRQIYEDEDYDKIYCPTGPQQLYR